MRIKKNNLLFLLFTVLMLASQFLLTEMRWGLVTFVSYLLCFGIGLLLLRKDETDFFDVLPYNKGLKPVTALLTVALVFLMMPLVTALAYVGNLIGGDMMRLFYTSAADTGLAEKIFTIAVIPAVFEEMFFRGFFYAGFRRARGVRFAMILSAVLFGFYHCNIQQIIYAALLGVLIGLLREMTGSMWAGMLYHFVNNLWAVIQVSVPEDSFFMKLPMEQLSFTDGAGRTVYTAAMILGCTALAVWVLFAIAKREGRSGELKRFFRPEPAEGEEPPQKEKVFTATLIIGCVLLVLMTALITAILLLVRVLPPELLQTFG